MAEPPPARKPRPWESEDAAFRLLLRIVAVCLVIIALSFALKAIL